MPHFDIAHQQGSVEFERPLRRLGLPTRVRTMKFGDFAFYGQGPTGTVRVGIERKTIGEMVGDDSQRRFVGHQLPGLIERYDYRFLIVEGLTKVDPHWGSLLEGKEVKQGKMVVWFEAGWGRGRQTFEHYTKRDLTLRLKAALHVLRSANREETAFLLHALYGWFQKDWKAHKSAFKVEEAQPDAAILDERTMRRKTFNQWPYISWERSARVSRVFRSVTEASNATVEQWMVALNVKEGRRMATEIVAFLHGKERDGKA